MDQLIESYKKENLILFIGAGVSKNLGLPSWGALIAEVAEQLSYSPPIFETYGDYLSLAEYYKLKTGSIGPLRSWMDRTWHDPSIDITKSKIHETIAKSNFPLIYTTNYDRWLENAHNAYSVPYKKISKVSDLVNLSKNTRQIVKFHGDFDDDESIVFDETSYFERLSFESPMDIKLRSDILGKSVLFIGYSISDINIKLLFYKLSKLWKLQTGSYVQPKSYIFSHKHNPIQELVLEKRGIKLISSDHDDPETALVEFLQEITK